MTTTTNYGDWNLDAPELYLNPNETDLLINALNSNKSNGNTQNQASYNASTLATDVSSTQHTEFTRVDGFDWDLKAMENGPGGFPLYSTGLDKKSDASEDGDEQDSPEYDDGDIHDKRKADSPEEEDGSGKRQETGKKSQKPGRKPLTSEPTTKRKAQNRAAQRAFRERKEKHLKDLEDKVDELQQKSDTANSENALLKQQIDRLQIELTEYRKRMSTGPAQTSPFASNNASWRTSWDYGTNFNFDVPNFSVANSKTRSASSGINQSLFNAASVPRSNSSGTPKSPDLSTLFSADVLSNGEKASEEHRRSQGQATRSNSTNAGGISPSNTASPASSGFNGFTSSCVTTPEASADLPEQRKPSDAVVSKPTKSSSLSPTGPATTSTETSLDFNSFDWLANQNGGEFNPQLFGDFREPQESIMNNDGWFFDDAYDIPGFSNDLNNTNLPPKKTFIQEIEEAQDGKEPEPLPAEPAFLTCNKLWDRVSKSEKVLNGEADMDELCSQLKAKAKCSGNGAVIAKGDVDRILGPKQKEVETNSFSMFK